MTYTGDIDSWVLKGSRLEEPDDNGDIKTVDSLGLAYNRDLSETLSLSSGVSWRQSEDNNISDNDLTGRAIKTKKYRRMERNSKSSKNKKRRKKYDYIAKNKSNNI